MKKSNRQITTLRLRIIQENLHLSNIELSALFGISKYGVAMLMKRHKIKRPPNILFQLRSNNGKKANIELQKKYSFKKENNPNWKGGISQNHYHYKKLQIQRYPDKVRARQKVRNAVKNGKLIKLPCEMCNNKESFAHHEDYSKPLDVMWLCRKHHREKHDNKH